MNNPNTKTEPHPQSPRDDEYVVRCWPRHDNSSDDYMAWEKWIRGQDDAIDTMLTDGDHEVGVALYAVFCQMTGAVLPRTLMDELDRQKRLIAVLVGACKLARPEINSLYHQAAARGQNTILHASNLSPDHCVARALAAIDAAIKQAVESSSRDMEKGGGGA